ncbi:RNA polymerase sigma-70 factor [Pedobacter sp. AW31-3R]|uniref:RNA polymerase sigma-70 factor n=1 Tax=Pedobacter sp. AW31-3R TaxID=3445781 RepID=UPI003FA17727
MNHDPEEHQLLFARLKMGDEQAYVEIYHAYSKFLLQAAYHKTRDKLIAEDIVQNIFISIWEKRESLEVKDPRNYLMGCLKFSIINYIRSQVMQNKYIAFAQNSSQENEDTSASLELKDLSSIVEKGISTLPDKTQEIFRLSRFKHQSTKKISVEMNISEKTVEYHITRSLKLMKAYLKNYHILLLLLFKL